jgi:hypothetical protein
MPSEKIFNVPLPIIFATFSNVEVTMHILMSHPWLQKKKLYVQQFYKLS